MYSKLISGALLLICIACNNSNSASPQNSHRENNPANDTSARFNPYKNISNIPLPQGFTRAHADSSSFAYWLQHVSLKKDKTVYLYNGSAKANQSAQFAVLDIPIGNKDLQQCADAVMRLRAMYLFENKKFDEIIFRDNENGVYQFDAPYTAEHFDAYLQKVFGMCGSASLSKQLKPKKMQDIEPGDVLIRGGFPGHAVIVMDVATNNDGKKIYLLAQSFMPAQDIHILNNPADKDISPWLQVNNDKIIETPEYTFTSDELKTW